MQYLSSMTGDYDEVKLVSTPLKEQWEENGQYLSSMTGDYDEVKSVSTPVKEQWEENGQRGHLHISMSWKVP